MMRIKVVKYGENENKENPEEVLSKTSWSFCAYSENKTVAIAQWCPSRS